MKFIKRIIYTVVIASLIWSCGGSDPAPTPPPDAENEPPTTPTQVYPLNNELCIDEAVNFQWNASTDPEGDSISYIVEVSDNNAFSPLVATKTVSTTSTIISLEKGIAYYWRVTAKDSENDESSPSSGNGFYTEGDGVSNYVPFSPELVSPTLGEIVQVATATLEWTASDVDGDTLVYDVYFGTENPPTTAVSENQSGTSFTVDPLSSSTTYYWEVVVKDDKGGQSIGQVWSFITD